MIKMLVAVHNKEWFSILHANSSTFFRDRKREDCMVIALRKIDYQLVCMHGIKSPHS